MKKQVQIDYELFLELVKYFNIEMEDPKRKEFIKQKLEEKVNKLAEHEKYSRRFKNSSS